MQFEMIRDDEDLKFSLVEPGSEADWIKYFDLRWRVLARTLESTAWQRTR